MNVAVMIVFSILVASALQTPVTRRSVVLASVSPTWSVFPCLAAQLDGALSDKVEQLEEEVTQFPAAVMLRVAALSEFQEQTLHRAAALSDEERFAAAVSQRGLPVGPADMARSVDFLLRNTNLAVLPGCAPAAKTIGGIKRIAESNTRQRLSKSELERMAMQYAVARGQLEQAFAALPEDMQLRARALASELQAAEDERRRYDDAESARMAANPAATRARAVDAERDSVARRRQLGQQTSANELDQKGVAKALYGR